MPEARPTFVVRSPRLIHPLKITGLAELARLVLNPQMPPTCMPVAPLPVLPPSSDVRAASLVRRSSTTPLLAEGESDHAHRHADVACRAVERHRGVVDDIAHGSVVDHAGQNAAVGAFRGFDRQRTGGVEGEIFDDGSGAQCARRIPMRGWGVELSHTMWKLRIECPCPSKKPVNGRPDSIVNALVPVSGQTASPIGVHVSMPVMSMSLSSTTETSFILPGGETFARIDCRGEFDEIVGRLDTARRREGVERFGEMSGREDTVLLVVGAYSRFVDVFCVGSAVGRREREFQTGLGDEAPYGELDCLGTGQVGVIGEMQRQFRSRSAGGPA